MKAAAAAEKETKQRWILEGTWKLEKLIGKDGAGELERPWGIGVSPDGSTVAIADCRKSKVHVYSAADLQHRFSLDTRQGKSTGSKSWPTEVQISFDGIFYVTDESPFVSIFEATGLYAGKWAALSPQHVPSDAEDTCLEGLTMDTKGHLLVGETKQKYISEHKPDGSHVASIKVDIAPWSLAVTSQDAIIISDWLNTVHIVDNKGQLLHTVKQPTHVQGSFNTGVACYEDIICICNYFAKRIHCYSVSGDYLRDFPINIQGGPRNLAFTPDGKQLMVSYGGVHIFGTAVYRLH